MRSITRVFALAAGMTGLVVMVGGWIFNSALLRSVIPGAQTMKVNTALCLMLASSAILLESGGLTRVRRRLAVLCAGLVVLISGLTLIEHLGWSFGIDELLVRDRTPVFLAAAPGRMAVIAAACIFLLGCAFLIGYRRRGLLWQQFLALVVAVLCLSNLVGYLYGIKNFSGMAFYTGTAVHTASGLLLLSLATLFSRPEHGLISLVSGESLAGGAVRRLLPAALLVPLILGWLILQAESRGLNSSGFGLALFATANVVVFTYLIWTGGRQLNLMEREKDEAEESFRLAFEAAPSGMIMSDRDGTITLVNARTEELFGYRREELLGNSINRLVPEWSREAQARLRREFFNAATAGAMRQPREVSGRRKDGTQFLAEIGLCPIETQNRTCVLSSVLDITARRRAEEERQKFVSLADRSLEFIGMCDLNYNLFYINSAGMQLVGLDNLEAACRVKAPDYFFPEDRSFIIKEFLPQVVRDGHGEVEIRFRHFKTGAAIWMLMHVFNIFDSRGTRVGWATVSINITDRKQAEDALREALQQLELVTDNMPAAVARYSRDQRYIWVSRPYTSWAGRPTDQLVGRAIADVVGQEVYEARRPHIEKVLSGQREEFETRVDFLPGGARWFHIVYVPTTGQDLKVDGWIAVLADVTERHEAEERLRESEARFRAAFFQAAVGIAQTSVDGRWQLFNDRFCEILGYSRNELCEKALIEKTLLKIAHPDDREAFLAARHKLLKGEISSWSSEGRYIRKDGVTGWARVFVSLVRTQDNEPQYFVTVVEDITEKIQAERALQQSQQELQALAGRLMNAEEEERKRISRELHDELSQKLALLAMDAGGLLTDSAPPPEKVNEQLRSLQARVQKLAQNVRQISHQLHPSILDDLGLVAALTELCDEFSAREGTEVACETEDVPTILPVDIASSLYRVSQEALHNILKHAQASQVRLKVQGSPEGIHLCIHDNGVGFDSEARLSQPGLGIVSMKERVRLVQGDLSIQSEPGHGTEVRVFVPLLSKAA